MSGFTRRAACRLSVLAVTATLAAGLVWGITSSLATSPVPSSTVATKVTLHVGWTAEPDNLNPFIGYETSSIEIFHLNYDYLVGFRASDLQPVPELATSWSHSSDGKIWTFKLRQGVKWQDGVPFTARDVAFTFTYIIKNQLANFTSYTGFMTSVKALDDYTVEFTCTKSKANMLGMVVPIVPEHIWSQVSGEAAANSFANNPPIVGTGPFQVVEWKKGQYVKMEASPDYWRGRPKVDEIVFSLYQNPDNMASDLKTGALQVAWDIPQAQFQQIDQAADLTAIGGVLNGFNHLGFNCYTGKGSLGNPVLTDWRFRNALNYAVDKQQICTVAYYGHATPATTIIRSSYYPSSLDWHWQPPAGQVYGYDPDRTRTLLDDAGYRDTNGDGVRDHNGKPIVLRLWARTQSTTDQRVGKLIAGWLQAVGLKVEYEVMDEGAMIDKIYNFKGSTYAPDYDLFLWYWYSDPDPNFLLSVLTTSQVSAWSDTQWTDPEYDKLYAQQQVTLDPKARQQLVWRMQQIVFEKTPYIPLTYPQWLEGYNSGRWTGWVRTPAGDGPVIYTMYNIDSYLFVHPGTATDAQGGGSSTGVIVLAVVAVAVAAVIAFFLLRRRRPRAEEL